MKRSTIIGALLLISTIFAKADLGDTYSATCREFGGDGTVIKGKDYIVWSPPTATALTNRCAVSAEFRHNQCTVLLFKNMDNQAFAQSEIWRILIRNAQVGQTWTTYHTDSTAVEFRTHDGLIYASWMENGTVLRVAYKSWLDRHHIWSTDTPTDTPPPVEENEPTSEI